MRKITLFLILVFGSLIIAHAQTSAGEDIFFNQVKAVFEAQKSQFKECTGKLIKKSEEEETFECTLKLEGFATTILKDEFDTYFIAKSTNYALAETNVKKLLNTNTRESEGIIGYVNIDDKKDNPNLYNECMTATSLYSKTLKSLNIHLCEKPSHLGFVIKVN